ncbi:MAG: DUF1289 domain-containing protein, partial [Pseudomonadota bacterium]
MLKPNSDVPSPCISVCELNDDDLCVGCLRTSSEIGVWRLLNDAEKRAVWRQIEQRRQVY